MTLGVRVAVGLVCLARAVFAQGDSRLSARLDKPTLDAVTAIVDSARISKLPTAPLIDKALEGAARGVDGQNIVMAVHQLSIRMGSAKRALASNATPDEIKAAASALDVGVSVRDLARLRAVAGKQPVTVPLAVLTDLVGQKVPIPTATDLVLQFARSGVKDSDLALFQRNVRSDVDQGADPTVAATTRARGLVARGGPPPKPSE